MHPSLEYFIFIANTLNITRAAEELHITQQGLSRYLKNLEDYFGTSLFTRKPTFALTPFGKKIYRYACSIQKIYDEIDILCSQELDPYKIKIGLSTMLPPYISSMFPIREYCKTHSNVVHYFAYNKSNILFDELIAGKIDILITMFEAPYEKESEFIKTTITNTQGYILIHPTLMNDYFKEETAVRLQEWESGIDIKDLGDMPLIVLSPYIGMLLSEVKNQNYSINIGIECEDFHMALELCDQSLGAVYLPWDVPDSQHPELLRFPVKYPVNIRSDTVKAYTTKRNLQKPYFRDFWNMLC